MKRSLVLSIIFSVFLLVFYAFAPRAACAAGPIDACSIFTRADAEALFNEKVASQKSEKVSAPAGNMCSYFFKIKGSTYTIRIKISSTEEIKAEGIFKSARDVFDRQKKARMANSDTAKKMRFIPALGEEASWNGFDLWIVQASYLFVIQAHPYLSGSYKTSEAMQNAREQLDLNYSQKMALIILSKISK